MRNSTFRLSLMYCTMIALLTFNDHARSNGSDAVPSDEAGTNQAWVTATDVEPLCQNSNSHAYLETASDKPSAASTSVLTCVAPNTPSCVDIHSLAYYLVTTNDTFCCLYNWDEICQNAYNAHSPTCLPNLQLVIVQSCAAPPPCVVQMSYAFSFVLANIPDCCNVAWNTTCQDLYNSLSSTCNFPLNCTAQTPHDCIKDDYEIYLLVLSMDPYCCTVYWDKICQDAFEGYSESCNNVEWKATNPNQSADDFYYASFVSKYPECKDSFDASCISRYRAESQNRSISGQGNSSGEGYLNDVRASYSHKRDKTLLKSYPNPTTGISYVTFSTPREEYATLEVIDISGRRIKGLFSQVTEARNDYRIEYDGLELPNGVYLYRLTTESEVKVEKFMIAR